MIRIQQLKLPITHTKEQLIQKIARELKIPETSILKYQLRKQSIDARKKNEVLFVYTIDVQVKNESMVLHRVKGNRIALAKDISYSFPMCGSEPLKHPPVIIGSGPAGLFCAYLLAQHGYAPIIIERGKCMEERTQDVEQFWENNKLNLESNVQFGEGGAGTFSDGKLNTLVKDVKGRNQKVLDIFIKHGAPEEIGYQNKPHIGTDILRNVIVDMRRQIEAWGGTYLFETCVKDIKFHKGKLTALETIPSGASQDDHAVVSQGIPSGASQDDHAVVSQGIKNGAVFQIETELAVLAIGHSARDTFQMLYESGFEMQAKSFAVGLRVEHPQAFINESQYGKSAANKLPAASYKLTANLENGRGVYSFCMCPGGYVVNASSEEQRIAVNGMSYSGRSGKNANSAIIVTVTPEDFGSLEPLSGVAFQRRLEEEAYKIGNGKVPQQLFGDFEKGILSTSYGSFESSIKGQHQFGGLHQLFSKEITKSFCQGMHQFANYIPNFAKEDVILSGVESRTSSPVRINRNEFFESNRKGVYPCGEGAGYAGGIMSAAMDGMKVAEAIAARYIRKYSGNIFPKKEQKK